MKILFLTTAHNGLSQRAYLELTQRGYQIKVQIATSEADMEAAVDAYQPHLIIAPYLKTAVSEKIWKKIPVLIVHPGIKGDRGPSSLDWAIMNNWQEWGVTILQACEEMDAGDIWAAHTFTMREVSKSCIYRHEVTQAAIQGILEAVAKFKKGNYVPEPLDYTNPAIKGKLHSPVKTSDRRINWQDSSQLILKQIRAADSTPGALVHLYEEEFRVFGAHPEDALKGKPGEIIAKRNGAICLGTSDGALWISHLKKSPNGIKLPATLVLGNKVSTTPELPLDPFRDDIKQATFREIWYQEKDKVGYLHFDFYNGAMSTDQCNRLREAFIQARKKTTKVIVLMGGHDIWSNGIHLNIIENSENPGQESWNNIVSMDDLIREIITTESHIVISAMQGNAGAGGAILALAADKVFARRGIVLNPHYKKMGNLYGSEYWTYLLPKRVGERKALALMEDCLPISTDTAKAIRLIDEYFGSTIHEFSSLVSQTAEAIANSEIYESLLATKQMQRVKDEAIKPLALYREEELEHMKENFFGKDPSYHVARFNFVHKVSCMRQPLKEAVEK